MKNNKNIMEGVYFVCDQCGQEYTFSQSFLVVSRGEKYCPCKGTILIAEKDLCRDCSGQSAKLEKESQLLADIAEIDAAIE